MKEVWGRDDQVWRRCGRGMTRCVPIIFFVGTCGGTCVPLDFWPLNSPLLTPHLQYLLDGLKGLCEMCIAKGLTLENTVRVFELSEAFSAPQLAKRCVLYVLEQYDDFVEMHGTISACVCW